MKKQLLISAVLAMAAASASAFQWEPAIQQPNPSLDVTQAYQLETMRIAAEYGLQSTDVMPKWIDEDGYVITGSYSDSSDPDWGSYVYEFNFSDFKGNGEYILQFPEGMLKNAAGELSDQKEFYYTVDIEMLAAGMFDDFEILSISPDLSQAQAIWNNQVLTVNTNHNEAIGVTTLSIIDTTTRESIVSSSNFSTNRTLGDKSPISWEVVGPYKFIEGHDYRAELVFYNGENEYSEDGVPTKIVDRAVYEFTGRVEGFKYSDITLLGVSPAPMSELINRPEQAVFTYTFSGPVTIVQAYSPLGQNGQEVYPASCLSSNEDKTVWTLDLSDNAYVKSVDAVLTICISARDLDGFQLKGEYGEESGSYFQSEWQCDLGGFPLVVVSPALGESLDRLSEIVVKAENGEPMSISWMSEAYVKNILGQVIGTLVFEEPADPDNAAATEFRFTRWFDDSFQTSEIDLVKEGRYTVEFGAGCFLMGDQFESKQSRSITSAFSITGALDEPVGPGIDPAEQETFTYTAVDPENGATVESLATIKLTFPEEVAFDGCEVKVYDAAQNLVTTGIADYDWDLFMFDVVYVKLAEPVVAAGEYEVVIPARTLCNNEFSMSDGQAGICNPEIRLSYTVGSAGPGLDPQEALKYAGVSPEVGATVKSLDTIVLSFAEPVVCEDFEVSVFSADQTLAATGICRSDFSDPTLIVVQLNEAVNAAGTYDIVIPARKIINGDYYESDGASGLCNPEYRLVYTVEGSDTPGVDPAQQEVFNYTEVDPADGSTVNELSNISLWFPDVVLTVNNTAYVYKADATEAAPVTTASVNWTFEDDYMIKVALSAPISDAGEYVVVIPARTICDDAFFASDGDNGICNPEIRLVYTVNPEGGSSVDAVAAAAEVDVFDVQGRLVLRNASSADLKTLSKGIYVVGGRKIVVK